MAVSPSQRGSRHIPLPGLPGLLSRSPVVESLSDLFMSAGIAGDLERIEQLMLERTASRARIIAAAGAHTLRSGGKRLRAALALLAARLGTYEYERVCHAAASAELIHAASLVHDDLVDAAERRRGQVTVHTHWGADAAVMVGDYFFALAAGEMALTPDPRIITFYAQAVQTIVEGELSPVTDVEPFAQALDQYVHKIGSKTAVLFEAACKAGMVCGGGSEPEIAALGRYGYDLGLAFQMVDDILDYTGDMQTLGKPAGNDLLRGTITLPLIHAWALDPTEPLRTVVTAAQPTPTDVAAAVADVIRLGGVEQARQDAAVHAHRAISQLDRFPGGAARRALTDLAYFVLNRAF